MKKNVLVQGSILAAASIIVRIIGLIYRIPLTRILGDTAMGYYSYAYEIYSLCLILSSYSLPLSVSKLVSTRIVKGEYKNSHRVFRFSLIFGACIGFFATAFLYFIADAYAALISNPNVAIPLRVLAPTIFFFSVMGVIRGYFQGHNDMVPTAISQIVEQIVNAVVSIAAAYFMLKIFADRENSLAYGAAGGTMGTLSGAVAALITLVIIYMISGKAIKNNNNLDTQATTESYAHIFKVLVATALPVILSQTIYQISGSLDSVIYNVVMTAKGLTEEVRSSLWGIYSNKYRLLSNVPVAIASAMGTAVVPSLISEYVLGHIDAVKQRIATVVKFNMIIAFPCAIGLSVLAKPILILLFGDGSAVSANMLHVGGICVVFFALSTVTNGVLQGINKMSLPVIHSAISLAIHIPVLYLLLKFTNLNAYALVICNCLFPAVVCV
ncbi:MAG: polysaccharide biosynthesis protein, partial [Lachnospiraceae bacterium]